MVNRRTQPLINSEKTIRASISFPEPHYLELERIAQSQRVSLAWVVRLAVEEYLKSRWPLLELFEDQQYQKDSNL